MIVLFVVVAMAIVAAVAVLVARDRPLLAEDPVRGRPLRWDAAAGVDDQDLADVRFAVVLRGYRMSEVDRVLADTREALVARDAQLAELRRVVAALGGHREERSTDAAAGTGADPQPTDPQPTDPQPTDPQPTDPQPTDPQHVAAGLAAVDPRDRS